MEDDNVPNYADLSDEEKMTLEGIDAVAAFMAGFTPDRVILFYAYLTEMLVGTLSARVVSAREMQAPELLDPRLNVAGMVLSTCMNEIRDGYDFMFNPEALEQINGSVNRAMDLAEAVMDVGNLDSDQLLAFLKGLDGAVLLGEEETDEK